MFDRIKFQTQLFFVTVKLHPKYSLQYTIENVEFIQDETGSILYQFIVQVWNFLDHFFRSEISTDDVSVIAVTTQILQLGWYNEVHL